MKQDLKLFSETVWDYYRTSGRELPWRMPEPDGSFDPYKIMVSEVMLQQTQVARVSVKYQEFLGLFPDISALAAVSFADVMAVWSGLGYNRRAKFLLSAAQEITARFNGVFPEDEKDLQSLPGIGKNTAAAIRAYAFNKPDVFIETNIRTVFIHHFFPDQDHVDDKQLLPYIAQTIDLENPREWYWALMDYGTFIKSTKGNASRSSAHYRKQSVFEGSRRQLRAAVIRSLLSEPKALDNLREIFDDKRLDEVVDQLVKEQLVVLINKRFTLT